MPSPSAPAAPVAPLPLDPPRVARRRPVFRRFPFRPAVTSQEVRAIYLPLIALFVLVAGAFAFAPLYNYARSLKTERRGDTKDYAIWYLTGANVLAGRDIYCKQADGTFAFMYPPAAATLLAVPALLGKLGTMIVLIALNTAAWLASILLTVYLITGSLRRSPPLLYIVPSLVAIPFIWGTYLLGQVNLLLLALMLVGFALLRRRPWLAGAMFGLAASIKAFPILVVFYLIYRRWWTAAVSLGVGVVLLSVVLPACLRGPTRAVAELGTWCHGMLWSNSDQGIGQRPQRTYLWKNQSLLATVTRLLRPVEADRPDRPDQPPVYVNVLNLTPRAAGMAVGAAALALAAFVAATTWRLPRSSPQNPAGRAVDPAELAMVLLLILMLSPYSFGYFYTWLLFPAGVVTWLATDSPSARVRRTFRIVGPLCALILVLGIPLPTLVTFRNVGNICLACLVLLIALGLYRWRLSRGPHEGTAPVLPDRSERAAGPLPWVADETGPGVHVRL